MQEVGLVPRSSLELEAHLAFAAVFIKSITKASYMVSEGLNEVKKSRLAFDNWKLNYIGFEIDYKKINEFSRGAYMVIN